MSDCNYNPGNKSCVYEVMCISLRNMIDDANDELDNEGLSSEQERKFHKRIADANMALAYVEKFSAEHPGVVVVSEFSKNRLALETVMCAVSEYHRLLHHDIQITMALGNGFGPVLGKEGEEKIREYLQTESPEAAPAPPVHDAADEDLRHRFERHPPTAKA